MPVRTGRSLSRRPRGHRRMPAGGVLARRRGRPAGQRGARADDVAFTNEAVHNVYFEDVDESLPEDDPRRMMERASQATVAYDLIPPGAGIRALYEWDPLLHVRRRRARQAALLPERRSPRRPEPRLLHAGRRARLALRPGRVRRHADAPARRLGRRLRVRPEPPQRARRELPGGAAPAAGRHDGRHPSAEHAGNARLLPRAPLDPPRDADRGRSRCAPTPCSPSPTSPTIG